VLGNSCRIEPHVPPYPNVRDTSLAGLPEQALRIDGEDDGGCLGA
jgi:hypothetical protein